MTIYYFLRYICSRFKVGLVKRLYQAPVEGEQFLLYPMHFHPESSTSILAGTYLDEYEVIRNIAFSLPEGVRLYVKDHISAWGYPALDFYRRIKRFGQDYRLGVGAFRAWFRVEGESVHVVRLESGEKAARSRSGEDPELHMAFRVMFERST